MATKAQTAGTANSMRSVFAGSDAFSHMPFLVDADTLVFCQAGPPVERRFATGPTRWRPSLRQDGPLAAGTDNSARYRLWKLFVKAGASGTPMRLETGLPDDAVECCPTVFRKNNQLRVCFVAGLPSASCLAYHLYAMEGDSLTKLAPAQPVWRSAMRVGCAGPDYFCIAEADGFTVAESQSATTRYRCSLGRLARISFMAENPGNLLLTGIDTPTGAKTLVYGLRTGVVHEIQAGVPVYKSSIFGKQLVMAQSTGPGIEPYRLVTGPYTLVASAETVSPVDEAAQLSA